MTRTDVPRLGSPGELVAALPVLCGFVPSESLVLVLVAAGRVVVTARFDLPPPSAEAGVAAEATRLLARTGADRVAVALCTQQPGADPRPTLVARLRAEGLPLLDVVLVRGGRWRSLVCDDAGCCPREGRPVPGSSPGLDLLAARAVLAGRAVLPSRAALEAALAAPSADAAEQDRWRSRAARRARARAGAGSATVRAQDRHAWRAALGDPARPAPVGLVLTLTDVRLRDGLLRDACTDPGPLYGVLLSLARRTPAPHDGPLCAVLAATAHLTGDGAAAGIAAERALASAPDLPLARLVRTALRVGVTPERLRSVLRGVDTGDPPC